MRHFIYQDLKSLGDHPLYRRTFPENTDLLQGHSGKQTGFE